MPSAAWPDSLAGTPAVIVIEKALERNRLAHSLLLHGDDLDTLALVAQAIADRLLNPPGTTARRFPPEQHPDFFALRPQGKARIIPIGKAAAPEPGSMRDFLPKLYISPSVGARKVAVIYEADRMNMESSNAFLKTLEEPPGLTTILLLTTRPYALLPTIRSRCLHFRFATSSTPLTHPDLPAWKSDYQAWLDRLVGGVAGADAVAGAVFGLYGLVVRFNAILAAATAEIWNAQKDKLPPDLEDDEKVAMEVGIANGIRQKLFTEIERATVAFAHPRLTAGGGDASGEHLRRALTAAVTELERCSGLLRLNLKESAALEEFLLTSLRLWSKRPD
ncbi:MAG TPA: DNA polymerase III subunit gamma/tau [Opitutaceae bacterium]|nr:DNA polymerase III subunit gamma/tau [Opitutaceae bacterium]